ncbi:hypothetical protein [Halopiger aswanensis]|uniref:Uncharacterized protein n=1 Tax=Halopiger aswanensis TaxID=148449 RepID=A0A419WRS5_9EURY|nr:hypothetical protein [Halopiger aswanensis]RKD98201.1 hypothetical protein ATJ93_1206 [Halopiger aswanensis]
MSTPLRSAIARNLTVAKLAVTVGFPAATVTFLTLSIVLEGTGLMSAERILSSRPELVGLLGCSLLIGLQVAAEVAAVRVDGAGAVNRGPWPIVVGRYLLGIGGIGLFLIAVSWVGLSAALAALSGETTDPSLLIGIAAAYLCYRSASAFRDGFRSRSDEG